MAESTQNATGNTQPAVTVHHRRRKKGGHGAGGHGEGGMERWLLTYADMITLLLALFIVLFSMSTINATRFRTFSQSLANAFNVVTEGTTILNPGHGDAKTVIDTADLLSIEKNASTLQRKEHQSQAQLKSTQTQLRQALTTVQQLDQTLTAQNKGPDQAKVNARFAHLKSQVETEISSNDTLRSSVSARVDGRGLVLRIIPDKVLFASGSASLLPAAATLLTPLARLIAAQPNAVRVEGHTDDVPIHTAEFPSNWELSTARATSVVRFLISKGVPPGQISAAGYADTHPIASNATAAGRAKNRRIEIIILRNTPAQSG